MTIHWYKLIDRIAVPCTVEAFNRDVETEFEKVWRVGEDFIERPGFAPGRVSTVFLGLDHQWHSGGPPLLFETRVFGGPQNEEMLRYSTWRQAERGHRLVVDEVRRTGEASAELIRQCRAVALDAEED